MAETLYRITYYEVKNGEYADCVTVCPNWREDGGCLTPTGCVRDVAELHHKDIYATSEDAAYKKLDDQLDERSAIVSSHIEPITEATRMIEQRIAPLFDLEAFEVE